MDSTHNPGRVAGFALTPRRLRPLPPHLYTQHSGRAWQATATANNIAAHELLFRLGIVSDLFCGAIVIFLGIEKAMNGLVNFYTEPFSRGKRLGREGLRYEALRKRRRSPPGHPGDRA
jgi:hypothetical protein